jgi:uncharacterized protein
MAERVQSKRPAGLRELARIADIRPIRPAYFTAADDPWLRALLQERERYIGRPRRQWRVRLRGPWLPDVPPHKLRVASRVIDRLSRDRIAGEPSPRVVRAVLFRAATSEPTAAQALAAAQARLGVGAELLVQRLFADLPDERELRELPGSFSAVELALSCNEAIVASLLHRAVQVRIHAHGQVRALVRHAKLIGLLCVVRPCPDSGSVELEVSGPYAIFRHTRLYGRALASLVPRLARCTRFRLEADCVQDHEPWIGRLVLSSGDPIAPARELRRYDSQVEARFARAFGRLALDWDLLREPRPIPTGTTLFFPDFELVHRGTGESWLLEIVGYWTPDYVARKLAALREAGLERIIVCVDETRACGDGLLEDVAHVVRYRRHVDPRAVIGIVDPMLLRELDAAPPPTPPRRSGSRRGRHGPRS